ncbi:uncharacterized protein C8A04DRAFT_13673 [Dichotomopilus funicola]|uniref:NFX1-type zinc finger-containing protein 1 n=1 Tax=Dichotomopilus funicola TaxID=1934379 RepID=A0AAN6UZ60_9PEZI|nr:hypothetical protein C8A04DRAFT_13673 [Dichotomopilus funicola]
MHNGRGGRRGLQAFTPNNNNNNNNNNNRRGNRASSSRAPSTRDSSSRPSRAQPPRGICKFFLTSHCTHGSTCRFSHDEADIERTLEESGGQSRAEAQASREAYVDFRRGVRDSGTRRMSSWSGGFLREELEETWRLAGKVLDGPGREGQQDVARDLGGSFNSRERDGGRGVDGLGFVQRCVEIVVNSDMGEGEDKEEVVVNLVAAMLRVVTHPSLVRSLSVDGFVGAVYRRIAGVEGDQGLVLFGRVNELVGERCLGAPESSRGLLRLMVEGLYEMLRRERGVLGNEALGGLVEGIKGNVVRLVADLGEGELTAAGELDAISARVEMIRRMMGAARRSLTGPGMNLTPGIITSHHSTTRSTFPFAAAIPGGHHDNDFADITRIQIFPTLGEITYTGPAVEFLPTTDLTQPHFLATDPVQRHLDSAFRLLRHDIFGPLKDLVGSIFASSLLSSSIPSSSSASSSWRPSRALPIALQKLVQDQGQVRAHVYTNASIGHLFVDNASLEASLSFSRPPALRKLTTAAEQRQWWNASSRLEQGGLLCFISGSQTSADDDKAFILLVVTRKNTNDDDDDDTAGRDKSSLVPGQHHNPSVSVRLAAETRENAAMLTRLYVQKLEGVVVELPGLIPDTFVPVLRNLQRMMRDGGLAFQRWILPAEYEEDENEGRDTGDGTVISPPMYARKDGFHFRLKSITQPGKAEMRVDPAMPDGGVDLSELEDATGLDKGQASALVAALTREYALIQGPPGTGKSYVGVKLAQVLLDHKSEADLGPLLVICYTNHALDQFLKHLQDVGIKKIIRIGGQSKCADLDGLNLRVVNRNAAKTSVESRSLGENFEELKGCNESAGKSLGPLHQVRKRRIDWRTLKSFLRRRYPAVADQFESMEGVDEDGFERVGERRTVTDYWVRQLVHHQTERIAEFVDRAQDHRSEINAVHDDVARRTLLQADVVGVTTTGLARHINMLCRVGIKVVVCEEAAEVMEPHLLSALMPGVEHLIQIGDHRQLRPQIQNYLQFSLETTAGRAHQLDRSQFERRAEGEPGLDPLPVAQLHVQRRMRPEIARLIRSVYPALEDHPSVLNLPPVVGLRDTLFWLDHEHPEEEKGNENDTKTGSHSNPWEVDMAKALVHHLVRQGTYKSSDIALLTPYTGQLQKLRAALNRDFAVVLSDRDQDALAQDGFLQTEETYETKPPTSTQSLSHALRLATVDNFQGEEARVIVVSLVRSNPHHKVGFLRSPNRINVLLSRAQHGLYLIGNATTYSHVPMWADVLGQLRDRGAVGRGIALVCPRHTASPKSSYAATTPACFTLHSPAGGCTRPCDRRLEPCGHSCPSPCHADVLHAAVVCLQPCPRIRETCAHACSRLCGEGCGLCQVVVEGVKLPGCGHVKEGLACWRVTVPGELETVKCEVVVEKTVPRCGHGVKVECWVDVDDADKEHGFVCPVKCEGKMLACGHACQGSCGRCSRAEGGHEQCKRVCDRPFGGCNHRCRRMCHEGGECGVCPQRCEVRCPHSRCQQPCQKPCSPCIEPCSWSCEHQGACTLPCAAPCNRLPCDKRCPRVLPCGHQCPGFCGEDCPSRDLCQVCGTHGDARVDLLEFKAYAQVDLDETPVAVLGCGHFFTGETLDGMLGLGSVYTTDHAGKYTTLKEPSGELTAIPACPDCRVPIRQFATRRYNRVVNQAVLDETSKRFLVAGLAKLADLGKRVTAMEETLAKASQHTSLLAWRSTQRYDTAKALRREATQLRFDMKAEHQPTKKLFDAIVTSQRDHPLQRRFQTLTLSPTSDTTLSPNTDNNQPPIPQPVYNQQITLHAQHLALRASEAILRDIFTSLSSEATTTTTTTPSSKRPGQSHAAAVKQQFPLLPQQCADFLHQCEQLIEQAGAASLPRLVVPAVLSFARVAQWGGWYTTRVLGVNGEQAKDRNNGEEGKQQPKDKDSEKESQPPTEKALTLLTHALTLCDTHPAASLGDRYREEVEEMQKLLLLRRNGPWYEAVSPAEIAAIKRAMVEGPGGFATHSGRWYTCVNGHPFAIGECGMPMEIARCPECGEAIGGQNHMAMAGTQRDEEMERA